MLFSSEMFKLKHGFRYQISLFCFLHIFMFHLASIFRLLELLVANKWEIVCSTFSKFLVMLYPVPYRELILRFYDIIKITSYYYDVLTALIFMYKNFSPLHIFNFTDYLSLLFFMGN